MSARDTLASIAAIERDAQRRIAVLREQRRYLAPEALTDQAADDEVRSIESELHAAERAIELAGLARAELGRRAEAVQ